MKKFFSMLLMLSFIVSLNACATANPQPGNNISAQKTSELRAVQIKLNPLPSWNGTKAKKNIIAYIEKITKENGRDFIPVEDRIAVFDNDGTLWAEKPVVQFLYAENKIKEQIRGNPALALKEPYKTVSEKGIGELNSEQMMSLFKISMEVQNGMTAGEYHKDVERFFEYGRYPQPQVPFEKIIYRPQKELIEYLQAYGFRVYICSGGDTAFMRVISQKFYGIPPENVIGSEVKISYDYDKNALVRSGQMTIMNNESDKPVNIFARTGKIPVFAGGNVGNAGDIDMLRYSQSSKYPSFQLLVNHDDSVREFVYGEADNASLNEAKKHNWNVISMKDDWKVIF